MSHGKICHQLRPIIQVYKLFTWDYFCNMYESGGHVTVIGEVRTIEKSGQEPGILSSFAFIVRGKNRKSIY